MKKILYCKTKAEFMRVWEWLCSIGIANTTRGSELEIEIGTHMPEPLGTPVELYLAAPDLLEALQAILALDLKIKDSQQAFDYTRAYGLARLAISRATNIIQDPPEQPLTRSRQPVTLLVGEL